MIEHLLNHLSYVGIGVRGSRWLPLTPLRDYHSHLVYFFPLSKDVLQHLASAYVVQRV